MTHTPFFSRTGYRDNRTRAARRRLATLLVAGVALALVLGAFSSQSPAARASGGAWTLCTAGSDIADPGAAHGVFVAGPNQLNSAILPATRTAILKYLPSDPTICGVNLVIPWSSVDQGPGAGSDQYDWTYLDTQVATWEGYGKVVNLIVWGADESARLAFGGIVTPTEGTPSTPAYLFSNPSLQTISAASCAKSDTQGTPVYWDPNYQTPWRAFQAALVAHVNADPNIGYLRFGLGAGGEDYPVDNFQPDKEPACWTAWQDAGLSGSQWLAFSQAQIDYEATLGSNHPLFVAINDFPDTTPATLVPDGVAAEAVKNGMGFGMQGLTNKQMTDFSSHPAACYADWCALFTKYRTQVPLEVQTFAQSAPNGTCGSGSTVCTGALPPQLGEVVSQAQAQVLELWPQEWLVRNDPTWSTSGASGTYSTWAYSLPYASALKQAACAVGGQGGSHPTCPPPPPSKPTCHAYTCR